MSYTLEEIEKKAKDLAIKHHLNPSPEQRYGGELYDVHLTDVVTLIKKYLYLITDEQDQKDVVVSGWCHDTVEDTDLTPRRLFNIFNENVARIVTNVSNVRELDKTKEILLTLANISGKRLSTYVKICDRMANAGNARKKTDDKANRMYKKYQNSYATFRFALKRSDFGFDIMWKDLDEIMGFKEHVLLTTDFINLEKTMRNSLIKDALNRKELALDFITEFPTFGSYLKKYYRLEHLSNDDLSDFLITYIYKN